MSVGAMEFKGSTLLFKEGKVSIMDPLNGTVAMTGTRVGTSYHLDQGLVGKQAPVGNPALKATGSPTITSPSQWH